MDGMTEIPASFWGAFAGEPQSKTAVDSSNMRYLKTWADRVTFEDWSTGDFFVRYHDGRVERAEGVMFRTEDVERLARGDL